MRKVLFAVGLVLAFWGCTDNGGNSPVTDADSLYTYTFIYKHHIQEPERCLALLDTAEMRGVMSEDSCNWLRGHICNYLGDYDRADEYLHRVLDREELSHTSDVYLTTLSTYCTFSIGTYENGRCLEYANEGARLAHEAGNARFEAEFYGIAGSAMEHERPGAGIEYLDRAISLIHQQSDRQLLPKASYYMSEKARIEIEQQKFVEAVTTCRERLALIDEMQQLGVFVTEGYYDVQLGRTYAKLALCLQKLGQVAEARQAAEAFFRTDFSKTIKGKHDILHYYTLTDDRQGVMRLFNELENHYQQGDSINEFYRSILVDKAEWHRNQGEWREADETAYRASEVRDSLILRDRNHQAAEYEVRFKTQEKEMALAEAQANARLQHIIIYALILILAVGAFALWRIIVAQKALKQKNRELFETVQQTLHREDEQQRMMKEQPIETLTSGQKLYRRLCDMMREERPYTNSDLKREDLAAMLGTNFSYLADAIRECSDGQTISEFLDDWRIRHAARMLSDSDEQVGLIREMSGFQSRSHFNTLFRERFKMTPSEYRKAAKTT